MAAPATRQSVSGAPKTRLGLSLSERIKVIDARKMGKSMRQLAAQFGCGKTQILNTLAQKERYIREWESMGRNNPSIGARKRFRHTRNEQINRSVYEWYQEQAASGLRVTGPMLQKQARHYAVHLGIGNFAASNGWLANFRRFYNIVSYSSHPKKQTAGDILAIHDGEKIGCNQKPSTSSSAYHFNAEFVPVGYEEASSLKSTPALLSSKETSERDPLEEHYQQPIDLIHKGVIAVKSEPVSDDEDEYYNTASTEENYFSSPLMCTIPTPNLLLSLANGDNSSDSEAFLNQRGAPSTSATSTMNHRKRRLLPSEHGARAESNNLVVERRIPKLQPLTPLKVFLAEFVSLARSQGLLALTAKDERGNEWVDIREPVASYRVPKYGYPTHLTRLIVDSSLQYYVEVLGHCVQKGSLLCENASNNLNYTEIGSILRAFGGGHIVCAGIDSVSDWVSDSNMRAIQELGNAENKFATQPDQRYRSVDCSMWIDRRLGPSCPACKAAKMRDYPDYPASPIDLRRPSSHSHQK